MMLSSAWRFVNLIAFGVSLCCFAGAHEVAENPRLDLRGMSRIELASDAFIVKGNFKFPTRLLPDYWALIDAEDTLLRHSKTLSGMKNALGEEAAKNFYNAQLQYLSEKYEDIAAGWDAIGLGGNAEDARVLAQAYKVLLEV